jgi:hypothetical protein
MAYYTYSDIAGATVLQWVDLHNIGKYTESAINLNKSQQGDRASVIGMAVMDYDKIFSYASVDRGTDFTSFEEADYNASLLYYIAWRLMERHIEIAPKGSCSENDYRYCAIWKNKSCEFLKKASPEAHAFATWCEQETCEELPADLFAVSAYDNCCKEWE